jgi:putative ABC transport system permease protein
MSSHAFQARVPLARRQLLHEPLKLGLALIGTALAVALVGLLLGLREGIGRQATLYEDNVPADLYVSTSDAHAFSVPGTSALPASMQGALKAVPGVEQAAPIVDGLTILPMHGHRIATLLVGSDPGRLGGPWKMQTGRAPRAPSEIAIDRVLAAAHGMRLGDTIAIRDLHLRIVGLTDQTASWMTPLLFVTRQTANLLERQGDIATFFLLRTATGRAAGVTRAVSRRFPGLRVVTRAQIAAQSRALLTKAFSSTLATMVLIALGVGTLVIGLSTYSFVSERRREYGALKAIGARPGSLYCLVSVQALAIALGGMLAGMLVAQLTAWGIHTLWPKFLFVSLPWHFLLLIVATLAMGLIGALVPLRVLARLDPAEVFR